MFVQQASIVQREHALRLKLTTVPRELTVATLWVKMFLTAVFVLQVITARMLELQLRLFVQLVSSVLKVRSWDKIVL